MAYGKFVSGVGLHWNNFFVAPFAKSKFAIYEIYLMLCASLLPPLLIRLIVNLHYYIVTSDMFWSNTKLNQNDPSHPIQHDAKCVEPHSATTKSSITLEKISKVIH